MGVACAVPALTGCSVNVATGPEAGITKEVLEKRVADALEKSVGQRPDPVECPGPIKAAGEPVRCELSAGADRYGLTATESSYDKDNGNADYDIEVDDEPAGQPWERRSTSDRHIPASRRGCRMSGIGKWNLGAGAGAGAVLIVAAVLCSVLEQVPAAVITGILGLVAVGIAGYDAIYDWLDRVQQRRRAARSRQEREREARGGR